MHIAKKLNSIFFLQSIISIKKELSMKYTNKFLTVAVLFCLLLAVSCEQDNPTPPPSEVPGEELAGTWAAVRDNAVTGPAADQFTAFSITITPTTNSVSYNTENSGDKTVFPSSGTFDVEASDNFETGAEIIRQPDGVPVTTTISNDGQTLTLNFNIDTSTASIDADNARIAGIDGEYTFILDKQ